MSCGPYGDAEEAPAVLDALDALEVLGAAEPVVDEGAPAAELGVTGAVDEGAGEPDPADPAAVAVVELVAAELPVAETAAVEVEVDAAEVDAVEVDAVEDALASPPSLAPPRWPRPDRPAWRSALERSCRNARKS
jgi:hypothetical protein